MNVAQKARELAERLWRLRMAIFQQPTAVGSDKLSLSRNDACAILDAAIARALEQPEGREAGVDRKRFEQAPCYLCGYNGPGYYQPSQHPCAALYHNPPAQQPEGRAVEWMREQAQRMRMADVDSATVEELGSYLSAYLRNTVDTSQVEGQAGGVKKQRRDLYNELADALGCDAMDSHEGRIARAKRLATTPPAKVPDGLVPPEAVEVKEAGGLLPTVAKGDWAIPNRVGARIVDARMAYGWNECRKEMLELLAAAQQPKEGV